MLTNFITSIAGLLLSFVDKTNYFGIFIGMIIESSFIPFPSEAILIPAGALISKGQLSASIVLFFAVLGSLIGALINFFLALFLGRTIVDALLAKHGKLFFLNQQKLNKADIYFQKHGAITTFVSRLIPGIRQIISFPAGFAKMNLTKFCIYTSLGAALWSTILIYAGYIVGENAVFLKTNIPFFVYSTILFAGIIFISYRIKRIIHNIFEL